MTTFLSKYKIYIIGVLLGFVAGFLYYDQIGCVTGTCTITSDPWASTAYGGIFGYFIADMWGKRTKPEFKEQA